MKFASLLGTLALSAASLSALAQTALPPGYNHPPMAGHNGTAPAAAPQQSGTEGTVVSAQTLEGYSYIEVTSPSGNVWLAAPSTTVAAGDKIRYETSMVMRNFTSKALKRTFPAIIFVSGVSPAGSPAGSPIGASPAAVMAANSPVNFPPPPPPSAPLMEGVVLSVQDAGGYSYIELKAAEGNTWLAGPSTKLKVGDNVRYEQGAVMRNFSSRALNRTFPAIVFVDRVQVVPAN